MATISRPRIRLGLRSTGMSMTAAEFDAWPASDCDRRFRYELIRGVLVVAPAAGSGEVSPSEELGYILRLHKDNHPQGYLIDGTLFEHTLPAGVNRRRCDRAVWVGLGRIPDTEVDFPAIVVEFVSRSRRDYRRDYEEKRDEYRQAGAREYWIIDRFRRIMTIYRYSNDPDQPDIVVMVAEAETYRTDLIPGFELPLARLFRVADQWTRPPRTKRKPPNNPPEGDPR